MCCLDWWCGMVGGGGVIDVGGVIENVGERRCGDLWGP
jgi:hypothetical protein